MRIGIDIGGTFTDIVAVDDAGRLHVTKALATPEDQSIGMVEIRLVRRLPGDRHRRDPDMVERDLAYGSIAQDAAARLSPAATAAADD
jgi:N-methylhydantoinase A/oxoprolinase/acetone carboxylase beta subunit